MAQAKEQVRGAGFEVASKRDEVAYRTAALYLDAERAARAGAFAQGRREPAEGAGAIQAQVKEGRALPLAEKQAALQPGALAANRGGRWMADQASAETSLAIAVGPLRRGPGAPVDEQRAAPRRCRNRRSTPCKRRWIPTRICGSCNRRSRPRAWRCAARRRPAIRAWTWWRSTRCSPSSITTRTTTAASSAITGRSAYPFRCRCSTARESMSNWPRRRRRFRT